MSFLRGWPGRLFLSHLLTAALTAAALITTALLLAPLAFRRMLHGMMAGMMDRFLRHAFAQALHQGVWAAAGAAILLATAASLLLARRLAGPLARLRDATLAVAAGDFAQRVPAKGDDEIAQLARSFNRMAEQLEQSRKAQRELTANVLHELGTPLSTLQGYLEGMQDEVVSLDPASLAVLQRETRRLSRLVRDLRLADQAEEGRVSVELQPVLLPGFLEDTRRKFLPRAAAGSVSLAVSCPEGLPVRADPDRLGEVLDNLMENALGHTPAGGRIKLSARREGAQVRIAVSDSGGGIAPEHLPHVFERFYRADPGRARTQGGSGLGLAIAKGLTEAQGGRVEAASTPGQGSTFAVVLPCADDAGPPQRR